MSEADIERIKVGLAAFGERDFDLILELMEEDAEVQRLGGAETLRGKEAIRSWLEPDAIEYQHASPTEFRENGNRVLVSCDWRVRGTGSKIEVEARIFLVYTLRGERITRIQAFQDEIEALEATGLSEQA
jgi:ketosteroid isomerase-like protein